MKLKLTKKQVICIVLTVIFVISIAIALLLHSSIKLDIDSLEDKYKTASNGMMTTMTLLQGDTSDDLQTAIDNAGPGDTIIITSDIRYTDTTPKITTIYEKEITIQSDEGNNWKLIQTNPSIRHFDIFGGLTIQNITLEGNGIGGGVRLSQTHFTMNEGSIIQNCHSDFGGAASTEQGSEFIMNDGLITSNTATEYGGAVNIYGTFYMYGGTISDNIAERYGGGVFAHQSNVYIYGGSILNNIAKSDNGGGIYIDQPAYESNIPIISNALISGNKALASDGGGIYSEARIIEISNTTISENYAVNGGGIYCSTFITLTDSEISNNVAEKNGGGIYIHYYYYMLETSFKINNTVISNNTTNTSNGGGIYLINENSMTLEICENSKILCNSAPNGKGGGIYISNIINYVNLTTDSDTVFSCNTASVAYYPPENASILYPNIGFASITAANHPLNNFDINYLGVDVVVFNITYDANGGVGNYIGPDIQPCANDIVLSSKVTGITNGDYIFIGWNTEPNGSGVSYSPGDSIKLKNDMILYAQWKASEYIVTFESNGGTPIDSQRVPFSALVPRPEDPTKEGYIFEGWYTDDRTFENEWDFNTPINENITLYAKWKEESNFNPCIWILILIFTILVVMIVFCKKILRIIRCIICKIKKWIRCLKYKCKCKCNKK